MDVQLCLERQAATMAIARLPAERIRAAEVVKLLVEISARQR